MLVTLYGQCLFQINVQLKLLLLENQQSQPDKQDDRHKGNIEWHKRWHFDPAIRFIAMDGFAAPLAGMASVQGT